METNKLTINEQFLTLEQAKELQELGVDFIGANTWFCKCTSNWQGNGISKPSWRLVHSMRAVVQGFEKFEYVPTLSVAEMIEMLPNVINFKGCNYPLDIEKGENNAYYIVEYTTEHTETEVLLRDSLFKMIKWLKQNKLI